MVESEHHSNARLALTAARYWTATQKTVRFCKWTLLTVLMKLDFTFEGETVSLLYALIRKKFPEPWELSERLSRFILKKGFTEPYSALIATLQLRSAQKLESKVAIIDAEGTSY